MNNLGTGRKITINAPPPYLNSTLHLGHLYGFSTLIPFYNLVDKKTRSFKFKNSLDYINLLNLQAIDLKLSI